MSSVNLPLFTALLILPVLNNECFFFPFRPVKSTFLYNFCIFPILNDDNAMHWPTLKKNPFSSFFVQASVSTLVASALPGTKLPRSPLQLGSSERREVWGGAGARAVPLKQISFFPFCTNENMISPCLFPGVCSPDHFVLAIVPLK